MSTLPEGQGPFKGANCLLFREPDLHGSQDISKFILLYPSEIVNDNNCSVLCTCSKPSPAVGTWYTLLLVLPHERTEVQGRETLAQGHGGVRT